MATDENQKVVWRWDSDAFGGGQPDNDPDGDGNLVTIDLRFPGQYYDAETGLHYNYFRYYDPSTGRYITSDPIGLAGGVNTYVYVGSNPLSIVDSSGLIGLIGAGWGAISGGIGGYLTGGVQGALLGVGAGAVVGFVNPFSANAAGAAAGGIVSGALGQATGNALVGNNITDLRNYDAGAIFGSALGGVAGARYGYYLATRNSYLGFRLGKPGKAAIDSSISIHGGIGSAIGEGAGADAGDRGHNNTSGGRLGSSDC